jgi:hypothetical protein
MLIFYLQPVCNNLDLSPSLHEDKNVSSFQNDPQPRIDTRAQYNFHGFNKKTTLGAQVKKNIIDQFNDVNNFEVLTK